MDDHTKEIREWLDRRFRMVDEQGIYLAHQPIYGFRKGHSEERLVERYVITLQIMKALSRIRFESLLDVGGAEGYKAALARELFGARVRTCDLSQEACNRAQEIFGIEGEAVDIQQLPFANEQFDVVLCSETLEHVPDLGRATRELLRVARRAVVITVPREPREIIERNIREHHLGAHVHALDAKSFDRLVPVGTRVLMTPMMSSFLKIPFALVEAVPRGQVTRYPRALLSVYNALVPALQWIFGRSSTLRLIRLDERLARVASSFSGMLFVLLKDSSCLLDHPRLDVSAERIVDFAVSPHRL